MNCDELKAYIKEQMARMQSNNDLLNKTVTGYNQKQACIQINAIIDNVTNILKYVDKTIR